MRRAGTPLLAILLLLVPRAPAWGGDGYSVSLAPALATTVEYDSNVGNLRGVEEEDGSVVVRPSLSLDLLLSRGHVRLRTYGDRSWHKEHPELDHFGWSRGVLLNSIVPLALTRNLSMAPEGGFSWRDDDTRREAEDLPGTTPLPETVDGRTSVAEGQARVSLSWSASPVDNVGFSPYWRDTRYDGGSADGIDSTVVGADGFLLHAITPRLSAGLYGSASRGDYEETPAATTGTSGASASWRLSESADLSLRAGYMAFYEQPGGLAESVDGRLAFTRRSPAGRVSLVLSHRYDAGGIGGGSRRMGGLGGAEFLLSPTWTGRTEVGWERRKGMFANIGVNRDMFRATARIGWRAYRWLTLHVDGSALRETDLDGTLEDFDKALVSAGFTVSDTFRLL